MARITVDSRDVMASLVSLSKKLADAIGWVYEQGRTTSIDVAEMISPPEDGKPYWNQPRCRSLVTPTERAELEILAGVLKSMGAAGPPRIKAKGRKKPRRRA
jgi:hypothetical protein